MIVLQKTKAGSIKVDLQIMATWECVACQVKFGTQEPLNRKRDVTTKTTCPDCGKSYIIHWGDDEWETWVEVAR